MTTFELELCCEWNINLDRKEISLVILIWIEPTQDCFKRWEL